MASTGFRGFVSTAASSAVLPWIIGLAALGCGSTLKVTKISAKSQRPSNVALYVDVHDGSGEGIKGLNEKSINIYEDGRLLPPNKARRALLPPRVGVKYTLLLVDMSGSLATRDTAAMASAVGSFVQHLSDKEEVAVSVFDGSDEVSPFLGFGAGVEHVSALVDGLRKFKPRDVNTNWNGAIYQGLYALEQQLAASTFSPKSAALVILTDRGADLSFRVGIDAMKKKVRTSPADVFVIGVGPNINRGELTEVGRSGVFLSNDAGSYQKGFDEISRRLTSGSEGRYVVSYCSPKRKGDHTAEIEVVSPSGKARVAYKFNADGFKAGCSPKRAPSLNDETSPPAKEAVAQAKTDQAEQPDDKEDAPEKAAGKEPDVTAKKAPGGADPSGEAAPAPAGPVVPAKDDEAPSALK